MSTFGEIKELPKKFHKYRDQLVMLFKNHGISNISILVKNYKTNEQFKNDWKAIWKEISIQEGGKLSLTTIGIILGSALGGVGIAAMGSAFGLPLALVLGLGGFLSGSKFDSLNIFGKKKNVSIKLSKEVFARLEADSKVSGIPVSELVEVLVEQSYAPHIE